MANNPDIRWKQRFEHYCKTLNRLTEAVNLVLSNNTVSDLEKEGLIQRFEFTHELAWKVMKDYLEYQGYKIQGSRDAIRQALQLELIDDRVWLESIDARNLTSHAYDESMAEEVVTDVVYTYHPLMEKFRLKMEDLAYE